MIYNLKNKQLRIGENNIINLTDLEHRFLISISTNQYEKTKDIKKFILNREINFNYNLSILKYRFVKKTGLLIVTKNGYGYKLINKINFE